MVSFALYGSTFAAISLSLLKDPAKAGRSLRLGLRSLMSLTPRLLGMIAPVGFGAGFASAGPIVRDIPAKRRSKVCTGFGSGVACHLTTAYANTSWRYRRWIPLVMACSLGGFQHNQRFLAPRNMAYDSTNQLQKRG